MKDDIKQALTDSRTWFVALLVGLLAYGAFLTWENAKARSAAELGLAQAQQTMRSVIDSQRESEERVRELNDKVAELTRKVAESEAAIRALRRQIIRLGETPVVTREGEDVEELQPDVTEEQEGQEFQDQDTTTSPGQSDPKGKAKGHDKDNQGKGQDR